MLSSVAEDSAIVELSHDSDETATTLKAWKYEVSYRVDRWGGLGSWTSLFQVATTPGSDGSLSAIQIKLDDLNPDQSYEVRARSCAQVLSDDGTKQEAAGEWSPVSKFVTLPASAPEVPVLSSVASHEPTKATAVFTVPIKSDSAPIPSCQLEYTTDVKPYSNWTVATSISSIIDEVAPQKSQAKFNIQLTDLQPESAYVVRARVTSVANKSSDWSTPTQFVTMALPKAVVTAIFPSETRAEAVVALKCSDPMDSIMHFEIRFREEAAKNTHWVSQKVERETSTAQIAQIDPSAEFEVGFLRTGRQSTLTAAQVRAPQSSANTSLSVVAAVLPDLKFQTQYLVQARVVGAHANGKWSADTPFRTAGDPDPRHAKPFIFEMPDQEPKAETVSVVHAERAVLVLNSRGFSAAGRYFGDICIVEAQFCGVGWHLAVLLRVKPTSPDAPSVVSPEASAAVEEEFNLLQAEQNLSLEYRANSGVFFSHDWHQQQWSDLPPVIATSAETWRVGDVVEAMRDTIFEPAMILTCPADSSNPTSKFKVQFVDATRMVSAPTEIRALTAEVRRQYLVFELSGLKPDTQYEARACFGKVTCPAVTLQTNRSSSLDVVPDTKCCDVIVHLHGCQQLAHQVTSREDSDSAPATQVPCFQVEFSIADSPSGHVDTITLPHVNPTEIPDSITQVINTLRPNTTYCARARCVRDERHSTWTASTSFETYTPLGPSVVQGKVTFAWAQVQVSYPKTLSRHYCDLQLQQRSSSSSEWSFIPFQTVSSQTNDDDQLQNLLIDLDSGGEVIIRVRLCFAKQVSEESNAAVSSWSKECAIVPPRLPVPQLRLDTALSDTARLSLVQDDNANIDAAELDLERLGYNVVSEVEWQSRSMIPLVDYAKTWNKLDPSAQLSPGKFELSGLSPGHAYSVRVRRSVAPRSQSSENDAKSLEVNSKWSEILHLTTNAAAPEVDPLPSNSEETTPASAPAEVPICQYDSLLLYQNLTCTN